MSICFALCNDLENFVRARDKSLSGTLKKIVTKYKHILYIKASFFLPIYLVSKVGMPRGNVFNVGKADLVI